MASGASNPLALAKGPPAGTTRKTLLRTVTWLPARSCCAGPRPSCAAPRRTPFCAASGRSGGSRSPRRLGRPTDGLASSGPSPCRCARTGARVSSLAPRRATLPHLWAAAPSKARPTPARPTPARPTPARPTPARPTPAARRGSMLARWPPFRLGLSEDVPLPAACLLTPLPALFRRDGGRPRCPCRCCPGPPVGSGSRLRPSAAVPTVLALRLAACLATGRALAVVARTERDELAPPAFRPPARTPFAADPVGRRGPSSAPPLERRAVGAPREPWALGTRDDPRAEVLAIQPRYLSPAHCVAGRPCRT